MKTLTFKTTNELKSATTNNMGTNPKFMFHKSDIKSINGVSASYFEISNKHVTHYIGGGQNEFINEPFTVILK